MTRSQVLQALMQELAARRSEPLSRHTFVQVGGEADWFVTVRDRDSLIAAVRAAHCAETPLTVLGAGSNVLIRDGGIRGVVFKNEARACRQVGEARIEVESGARFAALARSTARAGLAGLEWAAGIPGAIGGGLPTNAGAYGNHGPGPNGYTHAGARGSRSAGRRRHNPGLRNGGNRILRREWSGCHGRVLQV